LHNFGFGFIVDGLIASAIYPTPAPRYSRRAAAGSDPTLPVFHWFILTLV